MSEAFIERGRARLYRAANAICIARKLGTHVPLTHDELDALAAVVESAIRAVDDEGCLPSHLCTAVVKYGAGK